MTSLRSSTTASRHPVRRLAAALGLGPAPVSDTGAHPATGADLRITGDDELTTLLARLHDEHVERANAAVAEGREDLLQELSDSYVEEAMTLMAAAGLPPARAAQQLTA